MVPLGGPLAKVGSSTNFCVLVFKASLLYYPGRSICQSMFVCQVLCTSIQGIYAPLMVGPLAKVGSSAKFGVAVFKASILYSLGGPSAKVGLSANFCVSLLFSLGVHLPKYVHLPSFVYWYSRHLCSIKGGPLAKEGFSAKYEHTSKLLLNNFQCNCLQEIHSCFGGPLAKVDLSAKFGVAVFKVSILDSLGGASAKVGSSANCCVLVFKASMLYYPGGPSAKVCLPAKFCVLVFKASMLN